MSASEAQIRANKANSAKSTGPKTPEGKEISRANSYKHGLTGAGTVLPEREAIEVQRRYTAYCNELKPAGEASFTLVLRAATLSARMERCVSHETAMLTERVRQAEADFVPDEGLDDAEVFRLRKEAGHRALFDPSHEASLARKYEAAAERGYFRCLKELRVIEKQAKAAEDDLFEEKLASILPDEMTDEEFDAMYREKMAEVRRKPDSAVAPVDFSTLGARVDVPITVRQAPLSQFKRPGSEKSQQAGLGLRAEMGNSSAGSFQGSWWFKTSPPP